MKFKKGDIITPTEFGKGFSNVTVMGIKKVGSRKYYVLKILNGTVTIPIAAEYNYKLVKNGSRKSV